MSDPTNGRTDADIEQMTFEQAYAALQEVIDRLEAGEHALDEVVALYERGRALSTRCQALLDQAELRIKRLDDDGTLTDHG